MNIIHLFVVDGRVHDDGVDGSRGSSERRSRRVATAVARGATTATTTAAATAVAILGAGSEETLHSTGRHRRSFSLEMIWNSRKEKEKINTWHQLIWL